MTIKLYSKFHTPIELINKLPSGNHERIIPNAKCWTAEDEGNEFLFQELEGEGFTIRLSSFRIKQPTSFTITAPFTICFQISLFQTTQYELAGYGPIILHQRRYNLLAVPCFSSHFKISDNSLLLPFEICFTQSFLSPLRATNALLDEFMKQAEKGKPLILFDVSPIASTELLAMIDLVIECARDSSLDQHWLSVYVTELLHYVLKPKSKYKKVKFSQDEINRLYLGEYLLREIERKDTVNGKEHVFTKSLMNSPEEDDETLSNDVEWSITELALYTDMSVYTFTKLFKELFGFSVMNYRKDVTWQTVLVLLLRGQENLKTITSIAGYNDQPSFSRAFKKRFECTPSEFVQKLEKKLEKYKKSANGNNQ